MAMSCAQRRKGMAQRFISGDFKRNDEYQEVMGEILLFDTMSWVNKVLKLKQLPRREKKNF